MFKKSLFIIVILCLLLVFGGTGCARKTVRHLASDVSMVNPGTTTKQEVVIYLGQPDEEYQAADGAVLWVYHEARKSLLRDTPYVGDKIGEKTYEVVKVTFNGDIVQTVDFRTMSEEDFKKNSSVE
jgi:hypothetical protein